MGIGRAFIGARGRALPFVAFAVGALLPDIIDKPLYYAHVSDYVSCTRTFGHTGLFVVALAAIAFATRSRTWAALAVGAATHGLMDIGLDLFSSDRSSAFTALTWPFLGTHFYQRPFRTPVDQLRQLWQAPVLVCEVIGLALLLWEYRRRSRVIA